MLTESELLQLLKSSESHWVERKKSFDPSQVKEAIVAFANAVPEGQHAVLFIGVGPDGKCSHVENADKRQRDIRRIAEDECFPSIRCTPTVVREGGVEIIAVVVEFNKERPYFAGLPYVRVGSETIRDRQKLRVLLEDLIASRNDKVRHLLCEKNKTVTVSWHGQEAPRSLDGEMLPAAIRNGLEGECIITACNSLFLRFDVIAVRRELALSDGVGKVSRTTFSVPLDKVTLGFDNSNKRMKLFINF